MKNILKDKLEDGELDLSMMQYDEVPVKEIENLGGKVTTINLSHNLLTYLPSTFPLLSHLTKLDLSKNQLTELPDNFGQLRGLKWLDLYGNKLTRLPVSFSQLKNLKWLDLKDNLLVPAIQNAAGPCITPNDCARCAKKVVALLQSMESQLQREMHKKMVKEQEALQEKVKMEEIERERIRQEKRAAKDRRREELKIKEEERRREEDAKMKHQVNTNGRKEENQVKEGNGHAGSQNEDASPASSSGWLSYLLMFLLGVSAVGVAFTVSLVWIYSEGKLDSNSVHAALTSIAADMEEVIGEIRNNARPYVEKGVKSFGKAWHQGGEALRKTAKYVEKNYGKDLASARDWAAVYLSQGYETAKSVFTVIWNTVGPALEGAWQAAKPHLRDLGKYLVDNGQVAWQKINNLFE